MRNNEVVRPLEVVGEEVDHEDNEVVHVGVVERVERVGCPTESCLSKKEFWRH